MENNMNNKVLVAEGAKILGISINTINSWVRKGYIKDYGTLRKRLVDIDELKARHNNIHKEFKFTDIKLEENQMTKECRKCNRELPATSDYFNKKSGVKDGLQSYCRECNAQYRKQYSIDNPEYDKNYYTENKWQSLINTHTYNAKEKELEYNYTVEDWFKVLEYFEYKCAYCGSNEDIEIEHVKPVKEGGGFTKNNIVCACSKCNYSKKTKDVEVWASENNIDLTKVKQYLDSVKND